MGPLESWICVGESDWPGRANSLPVVMIAIVGRGIARTVSMPNADITAIANGVTLAPADSTV
jgi:hypothetical protein